MQRFLKQRLRGLPPYFGGKRKLLPWILSHLAQAVPAIHWPQLTFLDAFMGGGSVSLAAKACGFQSIYANDWSKRSQVIGQALLENHRQRLLPEQTIAMALSMPAQDFIQRHYSGSVFSKRHAQALDQILSQVQQTECPTMQSLWRLLLWHFASDFVCFPTSLGTSNRPYAEALDGLREWDSLNPKRYLDGSLESLLKPVWSKLEAKRKTINSSIFGGVQVQLFQQDARHFVEQNSGDILYLDPPYAGTLAYEKANRVLDSLLFAEQPIPQTTSAFSEGVDVLHTLFDSAHHVPTWVLSYGNRCIDLPGLIDLVKQHAGKRMVIGISKKYQHLAHVSKNQDNQELLIIATPKKELISCP